MSDTWETLHGFDPFDPSDAAFDPDGDGLDNLAEFLAGTRPHDLDNDGVDDTLDAFPGDPAEFLDTDADGVGDNADLDDDGDGMSDAWEDTHGFDPLDPADAADDPDGDGLDNRTEFERGLDPHFNLDDVLVGHWALDEGSGSVALDASAAAHHGALVAAPTWVDGVVGTALHFRGDGDRVVVPDHSDLDPEGDLSVTAWIRPDRTGTQTLVKKARHGKTDGWELGLSSGGGINVRFNQDSEGNKYKAQSSGEYSDDGTTWLHVAAVFDGQDIRIHLDGALDTVFPAPDLVIASNGKDLSIGAQDDGTRAFRGSIDDVRVFRHALSPAEVVHVTNETLDADEDGIGNNADPDDDNDGVNDVDDAFPLDPTEWTDTDGDGLGNNADPDDDNDGVEDAADAMPTDPTEWVDSDGDGLGDNADPDDDDDGMPDAWENTHGLDPFDPSDATGDADGDGISNLTEFQNGTGPRDRDNDGVPGPNSR